VQKKGVGRGGGVSAKTHFILIRKRHMNVEKTISSYRAEVERASQQTPRNRKEKIPTLEHDEGAQVLSLASSGPRKIVLRKGVEQKVGMRRAQETTSSNNPAAITSQLASERRKLKAVQGKRVNQKDEKTFSQERRRKA